MAYTLTYSFSNNAYSVTGYTGTGTPDNVVIPSTYNDGTHGTYPVTSIGSYAINDGSLISVTIPDSVTSIGEGAFEFCSSLTSITIGNSVISIGDYAFDDCRSLTGIIIPDNVTSIGIDAFSNCNSLTTIICKPEVPPTISTNTISFATTKIIVPKSSETAYKTALNWVAHASKITGKDNNYFNFVNYTQEVKKYCNKVITEVIGNAIGGNY